ncbi:MULTISPECIES: hypothetical protein [unclassified Xanthobacter]|uniref:hypothetical protein n=1 Tax=unclassified Xanthobacter TaxID=2623496 RepID=UPI001EDF968B|nr:MULTISPECIES: hypothetical protein [unclassified Xanthobacter]
MSANTTTTPAPPAGPDAPSDASGQRHQRAPRLQRLRAFWSRMLDLGLVLWVLRVPAISVVIGAVLMAGVTQAQDTLVDVAMSGARLADEARLCGGILALAATTFVLWAMPVHYAGRLLLETDAGIARMRRRRDQALAAPAQAAGPGAGLHHCDPITAAMLRWFPRVLGALTFLTLAWGARAAIANLPVLADAGVVTAASHQLNLTALVMAGMVPVFLLYTVVRSRLVRFSAFATFDAALGRRLSGVFRRLGMAPRTNEGVDDAHGDLFATGRVALFAYGLGVVALLIIYPLDLAAFLPLAFAVPLILGGWVPPAAFLSALGRRLKAPLLGGLLVASSIGVYLFGDNHDMRLVPVATPVERPTLQAALAAWRAANDCAPASASCPRPVIIAAAGGASRAGFFTASVIGHFLDEDRHQDGHTFIRSNGSKLVLKAGDNARFPIERLRRLQSPDVAPADPVPLAGDLATRLFAISGVSGGSLGAVVAAAALDAAATGQPPCAARAPRFWFSDDRVRTWQDCLEALTSGDYLTASFFGLAFYDQVQLLPLDRAGLLEKGWEARFLQAIGPGAGEDPAAGRGRLALPFLQPIARGADHWVPLLVLNGTSVATGQRIVTTDLAPLYVAPGACPTGATDAQGLCPIFAQSIDLHAVIGSEFDIAMSTAATNSARFPIISPPGTLRRANGRIQDRIVDGGYFENYGVQSALELAQAVVAVDPTLAPFILVISNDPQSTLTGALNGEGTLRPEADERLWLAEATGPIGAIGAVRSARGRLALAEADRWLRATFEPDCPASLAHIKVWPEARTDGRCPLNDRPLDVDGKPRAVAEIRAVSMSWWLSKPVQMNLREQLQINDGGCSNDTAVRAVWRALATPSDQCTGIGAVLNAPRPARAPAPADPPRP